MNFTTMEYFLSVAAHRNITKAAEELHITQQTLSAHIAALEEELDCKLIIRSKPLELTYEGSVFLRHAEVIYENWQSMWNEFNDLTFNQRGKLLVGVNYTRSHAIMPHIIERFQQYYPNIEVRLMEGVHDTLHKGLLNKDLDIAIARFPQSLPGVTLKEFYKEEIVMCVPKRFENMISEPTGEVLDNLNAFKNIPFVLGNSSDISTQVGMEMLAASDFTPIVKAKSNNIGTLLKCCVDGIGICFCPKTLVFSSFSINEIKTFKMYKLNPKKIKSYYDVYFGYRKTSYQWKVILEFIRIAEEVSAMHGF